MAELIFNETTVTFSEGDGGVYSDNNPSDNTWYDEPIELIEGETYTVVWDGNPYACIAESTIFSGSNCIKVGNAYIVGGEADTGEPFVMGYVADYQMNLIYTLSDAESHTIAIYKGEVEEDSGEEVGNVILENRTVAYSADDGCWIAMNDEGTGPYLTDGLFSLTEGKTYTIVINGVEYVGEASKATVAGLGEVIGIGNGDALAGGEGNGEPYAAGFAQAGANASTFVFFWFDTDTRADTYTVSLYEGDITSGGGGTEDGYLLKDAELDFELETNSETVYYNNEVAPAIIVGNTYTVIWDGDYYECVAKEWTADSMTFIVLGNLNITDNAQEDTGEPFLYMYLYYDGNSVANFKTLETDESHVISIYDGALKEIMPDGTNIVLLDRNGNPVTYEGIKTVSFNTADGKIATFTLSAISSN